MKEYTCPKCGANVGTAIEGSRPSFYHCGKRFPNVDEYVPDFAGYYFDKSLSLAEKEQKISTAKKHLENRLRRQQYVSAEPLHDARKYLKNLRDGQTRIACITDVSNAKVTKDRTQHLKAWRMVLELHARSAGNDAPAVGVDSCRSYAEKHGLAHTEPKT